MATTVYGGTTNHWRAYMTYATSSTDTTYSVAVSAAGMQSVAWGFSISSGIHVVLSATNADSTSSTWDGGFSSPSGATTSKSFGSRTFRWNRGKSAATKTVKITVTNSSGYMNGTSSKSISVTVPALPSYAVTFNANGGSGAPSSQTKWHGESLTLSSTMPTRTGYTFQGWATSSTASSVSYSAGATYTANEGATLYAVWEAITYTVSYSANGGSGAPPSQTKTYGVDLTLSSVRPTRTGYTFAGWNTGSDGAGTDYSAGGSYAVNAAVTLYAKWTIDTYVVSYDANGGSGAPPSQTKTYGVSLTLSSTRPTRANYEFVGWSASSTATGATYAAGGSYTENAGAKLYAVWKLSYWAPTVSSPSAVRCDSSGASDDEGTYALVSFTWAVCTNVENAIDTIVIQRRSGDSWPTVANVSASGVSGSVSELVSGFSTEASYQLRVVATDTYGGSSTASTIVSQAFFTLDFRAGGHGVGIGTPATEQDVVRIGMDVHGLADLTMDGDVSAATFSTPNAIVTNSGLQLTGSIQKTFNNIDSTANPSTRLDSHGWNAYDSNGILINQLRTAHETDGRIGMALVARQGTTASGGVMGNVFRVLVDAAGNSTYSMTSPENFRNALGASSGVWTTAMIPGLAASKITSGTLSAARGGTGKTTGLAWTSLGSATGTHAVSMDLTNYSEILVSCRFSHTYNSQTTTKLVTAVVPKALLTTSARELWLTGGKSSGSTANTGNLRAVCQVTTTSVTGVVAQADSTDHTSAATWQVFAR